MKQCLSCLKSYDSVDWKCPACGAQVLLENRRPVFAPELSRDNDGFEIQLFAQLADIEARNFWHLARNRLIQWAFGKYFPQAENFLEIGCGTGFVLQGLETQFPQLALYGSELYSQGLSYAAERVPQAVLFQMDARKIPFVEEFDVMGAFDIIEHVEEDERILSQMYQALKPGGGILLTVPQHPFLWSQYDERAHHVRRYRARELKEKVRRAGFQILKTTSFVSFLLPAMFASRWIYRKPDPQYGIMTELDKKGFLNGLLEKILDFEQCFIRSGVSFPVGGSRLLVARKPIS